MRKTLLALIAILALAVAGCGGASNSKKIGPSPHAVALACPTNQSFMGCSERALPQSKALRGASAPSGALYPDVSVWQGAVGWGSVAQWQHGHGWRAAGIFKLGEYTLDSQAVRNSAQTASLGFWRAGYWFVRNTGCAHEGALIVWAAQRFGLRVVVLDMEVPEANGYAPCLTAAVRGAGLTAVIYSAPGTWPGGSSAGDSVWVAAYGPSRVPCLFTCSVGQLGGQSILSWQFTDGTYGPVQNIPGIGRDDVSVDYGIERLGVPAPKPPPKPKPKPAVVPWSSAEIQVRGARPNATVTLRLAKGHWSVSSGRVRSLGYNSRPLGGG